jgi:hypothetical protein
MASLNGFVVVSRNELVLFAESMIDKKFVPKNDAYLKLYQREGRFDVISRLELTDLKLLSTYKLIKY